MSRRRRHLDMLPLLDVFMVIVFLFATIQEGTARKLEEEVEAQEQTHATELEEQRTRSDAMEEARDRARDALQQLKKQVAAARQASSATPDPRTAEVLDRLLEKATVVEIEITGQIAEDDSIQHACCFRTDPRKAAFRSCGHPPSSADEMERWLSDESAGLADSLRKTGGGAALTLIRQDEVAAYRVGARLAGVVRRLHPDRQVFAESPKPMAPTCVVP